MNVLLFCHSVLSDWNNGNAHFLRGLARELCARGHRVRCFEAKDAWSAVNLNADAGSLPEAELSLSYPELDVVRYRPTEFDVEAAVENAELVIVHEWNSPDLIRTLGQLRLRTRSRFRLLFHDTHHRSVTDTRAFAALDLGGYDGVLAFGEAVRERYLRAGWARRVWVFHEAADTQLFAPRPDVPKNSDLVFVGNWGDEERTEELFEFLFEPARELGLSGSIYGVRYPPAGIRAVGGAGLHYSGWLPNHRVPEVLAGHRFTIHVPRRPYARALPGIPTIRVFESLACGIPLINAPWSDSEGLFEPGDLLFVRNRSEARRAMRWLLAEPDAAAELASRGRQRVLSRHTCAHRVETLLAIANELGLQFRERGRPTNLLRAESEIWE